MQILICTECFCAVSLPCARIVEGRDSAVSLSFSTVCTRKVSKAENGVEVNKQRERMQMIRGGKCFYSRDVFGKLALNTRVPLR